MKISKIMFMTKLNKKMAIIQVSVLNESQTFQLDVKYFSIRFLFIYFSSDEYDHLDYSSRPGSSFKPHYHRMNDVLNITKDEKEVKESNIESSNNLDAPGRSLMDSKASYSSGDSNS